MGNLCIYSRKTDTDGAHFVEEEHILSAGLGGIRCLSKGMVSDEINTHFSKWEMTFMRDSPLAVPRQFQGPGKRGSLNSKKASMSQIHVYNTTDLAQNDNPEDVGLAYISLGEPHPIPTLRIKKQILQIQAKDIAEWESFIERLQNCPVHGFKKVPSKPMPADTALLGFHRGQWYVAQGKEFDLQTLIECIKNLKTGQINLLKQEESAFHVHSHQLLTYKTVDYYKVIAKYAFNFLAHCIGQSAILESTFDPLRDWIISKTSVDNQAFQYVTSVSNDTIIKPTVELPESAHLMMIFKKNEHELIALVYLYGGQIMHLVRLSANYEQRFDPKLYICDWKNRKEEFI